MGSDSENEGAEQPHITHEEISNDTIRILLATDNHIGYMERDPVRGQDSLNTFREILQLAVKHDVDFILLAGDLFHDNKPSRECLYRTMALLREYTLGDKPVQIELLSNPEQGKAEGFSFPAINYEDPNFNVAIPVFSIHGNHDDPQGAGSDGALCALDVLSVSGLVNYMGKIDLPMSDADAGNTGIAVWPVLLQKGNTRIGLYGIGNVKDQRMHFELRSNRVRMYMPPDKEDYFNILLLHQNRVSHSPQDSVPEGLFDDSIDLVVWGHEHDCRIIPEPVGEKNYRITQPGSSVATSLADGEALEKHVALLKIQGKEYEMCPIPLRTIRPFVIDSVVLNEIADEEDIDLTDQLSIGKFLRARVNKLIDEANKQWDERNAKAVEDGLEELPRMLPLIRLKVGTTGVSEMSNPIRFGQEFQGRIANPRDVLVFHRAKKVSRRDGKVKIDQPELSIDDPDLSISERLAKVRVAALVQEYLSAQELQLLGETGMSSAIQLFVEKDDTHAIQSHVSQTLKSMLKGVRESGQIEEKDLEELLSKAKEKQEQDFEENEKKKSNKDKDKSKAQDEDSDAGSVDSMAMDVDYGAVAAASDIDISSDASPPPRKKTTTAKAPAKKAAAPAKKAPAKKAPAKGRGKKTVESDSDEVIEVPDDEDDDDDDEPPPPKRTTKTTKAATQPKKAPAKKAAAPKQSQLTFVPAGRSSRTTAARRTRADDD